MSLLLGVFSCSAVKDDRNALPTEGEKWIEYVLGKPHLKTFESRAIVAEKWGINYEYIFAGCEVNDKELKKAEKYDAANQTYFKELEKQFGPDWREKFDAEVKAML